MEILECLDRQGVTLRQGNVRLLRAGHDATAAAGPAHPPRIQNRRTG
ncbi:SelB C-terminal domain-containing protein [Paracoccus versutus]